ncbi:MAG: hypothetical protein COB20_03365 [SAR86 cluster bacterium]|uniref:Uncharacterized protein n=1 Tax=SAR86 cluster bacterium TaxID=2030880 RepID=A0A2A4XDV4_9GAMM|nr:MAG: hypothetical protein COB20_03365 [SAR86 cluster bacterium]
MHVIACVEDAAPIDMAFVLLILGTVDAGTSAANTVVMVSEEISNERMASCMLGERSRRQVSGNRVRSSASEGFGLFILSRS